MKILIVDDSLLARKRVINTILEYKLNYEIIIQAKDGDEAFKLYEKYNPDLIITDLEMPKVSGLELIQLIRTKDSSSNIIVISSLANEQVKQTLKHDRFMNFVKKHPYT